MSENRLKAVIWDLDGVIADTGPYHCRAWQGVFSKRGVNFTGEDFRRHFGQRNDTIIRSALGESLTTEEVDAIAEEKEADYRKRVAEHISPLPGAVELIRSLGDNGVVTAIGSSAPPENIKLILRGLGIEDRFQAIAYGREVTEGKPSPQIFLLAAKKLGAEPGDCVVIEDAVAGVEAARKAGMKCVAVTNSHPRESLKGADLVVDSLKEVNVETLAGLWKSNGKKEQE